MDNVVNFAKVAISGIYGSSDVTVFLRAGDGLKLPTVPYNVTWWNGTLYPDPSDDPNKEIVRCTAVPGTDSLTVTRGQESTTPSSKSTGGSVYKMIAGITAKTVNIDIPALASTPGANSLDITRFQLPTVSGNVIATPGIGQAHIAPNQINLAHHLLPSVSGNVIATPGISQAHIAVNQINLAHHLLPSISGNVIATPGISTGHIAPNQINLAHHLLPSVSGNVIATPGISQAHIAPNNINLAHMLLPSISGNIIATPGIGQAHIAPNNINLPHMQLPSISGNVIATPAIGPGHLAQNAAYSFTSGVTLTNGAMLAPTFGQTLLASGSGIAVTAAVNAKSTIIVCVGNGGAAGNIGIPLVHNKAPGSSFNIRSTNGLDNSVIYWWILS